MTTAQRIVRRLGGYLLVLAAFTAAAIALPACALFEPIYDVPPWDAADAGDSSESEAGGGDSSLESSADSSSVDDVSADSDDVADSTEVAPDGADAGDALDDSTAAADATLDAAADGDASTVEASVPDSMLGDSSTGRDSSADSSDSSDSATPVCTPGATKCDGAGAMTFEKCRADGSGYDPTVCTTACSATGCTACKPLATKCDGAGGMTFEKCRADGSAFDATVCTTSCTASGCTLCAPTAKRCLGKVVQTCAADGSTWSGTTTCAVDCSAASCVSVTDVALSAFWACAVRSDSTLWCWGTNSSNVFGFGASVPNVTVPTHVTGVAASSVSAALFNSCIVTPTGGVQCLGDNDQGQLGRGTVATGRFALGPVSGLANAKAVSVGAYFACAIGGTDSAVYCWGQNGSGEIGTGASTPSTVSLPSRVGLAGATAVAAGSHDACAVVGGAVYCWGIGYLGDGSLHSSPVAPILVSGISGATSLVGSIYDTDSDFCAITSAGAVYCWGINPTGLCGDGTHSPESRPYRVVASGALALGRGGVGGPSGAAAKMCANTAAGAVCWGDGAPGGSLTPTSDSTVSGFAALTHAFDNPAGSPNLYECMLSGGNVFCASASYNPDGELGDGTLVGHLSPAVVKW